jgi:hypothetical protein
MTGAPRVAAAGGRTTAQWVSLVFGIGFLLIAVLGFVQGGMSMEADPNLDAIVRQLYPDQETFRREEQRRFEILLAHWDVPTVAVDLTR